MARGLEAKSRGDYHHGNLRRALLDGAVVLLATHSPEGLTLRELCRQLGVDHRAAYRHFADREALLAEISEEGYRDLAAAVTVALGRAGESAGARLLAFARAFVEFATREPGRYRAMVLPRRDERRSRPPDAADAAFAMLAAELTAGMTRGEVAAGDPTETAVVVYAAMHGLASLIATRRLYVRRDELAGYAERVLDRALRGVLR